MYLGLDAPVAFAPPWEKPFGDRRAALARGHPRVAYFYERPDTSTFRYRVHNMIEALEPTGVAASWFCRADLPMMGSVLDRADVLVLARTRYSHDVAHMIAQARARGVRVLFDVDDLVFDDRYVQMVAETLDQHINEAALDHWFAYFARMGAALRLCDGAITTNPFLAERIRDFAAIPTKVVPNFLNAGQLDISARIRATKETQDAAGDGGIDLGYFSGTPTHNRDFAIAAGAVADLMREDPRIRLRLVGFLDPTGPLASLADRINVHPLQDYLNLQRLIGEVELNLVPLQDNIFTNCKSELKVFEAAVVGTLSIASPSYTLARVIEDGATGYLAPAQSWPAVLRRAVAELPASAAMARRAADQALRAYAPEAQVAAIRDAVGA